MYKAHLEKIQSELHDSGYPEESLSELFREWQSTNTTNYSSRFARCRVARIRALAVEDDIVKSLALQELQKGKVTPPAGTVLANLLKDSAGGVPVKNEVLRAIQSYWETDAATAVEQLEVQELSRNLIVLALLVLFFFVIFLPTAHAEFLSEREFSGIWASLISAVSTSFLGIFVAKEFACGFFGLLGAILSISFDRSFAPQTEHWMLVRRSDRLTRCFAGLIIGILVSTFFPYFTGVKGAFEDFAGHAYFFSLFSGFSQDSFIYRIQSASERKTSG